jgi:hypothetical protein
MQAAVPPLLALGPVNVVPVADVTRDCFGHPKDLMDELPESFAAFFL